MNTLQLLNIVNQDPILKPQFLGVFASDELPDKLLSKPCALIANTDPSGKRGEHWVTFFVSKEGIVEYFDSFGFAPYIDSFKTFIDRECTEGIFNAKRLQSATSSVCGLYCVYFLVHRVRQVKMKQVLSKFDAQDYCFNDSIVCQFVNEHFNVSTSDVCNFSCKRTQSCKSLCTLKVK